MKMVKGTGNGALSYRPLLDLDCLNLDPSIDNSQSPDALQQAWSHLPTFSHHC